MRDRVEAVRCWPERAGATSIVEGWVEGPCAMSADLRGLNTLMLDFFDDPPFVEALFDFTVRMEVEFARAQVEAGATLIGVGDAAASLVGPKLYARSRLPSEQRLWRPSTRLACRCGCTSAATPGASWKAWGGPAPRSWTWIF